VIPMDEPHTVANAYNLLLCSSAFRAWQTDRGDELLQTIDRVRIQCGIDPPSDNLTHRAAATFPNDPLRGFLTTVQLAAMTVTTEDQGRPELILALLAWTKADSRRRRALPRSWYRLRLAPRHLGRHPPLG